MRKSTMALVILATLVFYTSAAYSSITFTPPDDAKKVMMSSIRLMAQKGSPKSSGVVALVTNTAQKKYALTVEVKGLDPKQVYTLWFAKSAQVKGKSQTQVSGIGTSPYTLKVDSKGNVNQVFNLDFNPKTRWQRIEIIAHPGKNPKDMKNSAPVLIGDLSKLG